MNDASPDAPLLDEAHAAFIQHRVSMTVASHSAESVPSLTRAFGCRVSDDRGEVTVFVAAPQSAALLQNVRDGGAVAVVFSRPSTHETLQLKGTRARTAPAQHGDYAIMRAYAESFCHELEGLGFGAAYAAAMTSALQTQMVGVTFQPSAAFVQTPGPAAGTPLGQTP